MVSFVCLGHPRDTHKQTHTFPRTSRAGTHDVEHKQHLRERIHGAEVRRAAGETRAARHRGRTPPSMSKRVERNDMLPAVECLSAGVVLVDRNVVSVTEYRQQRQQRQRQQQQTRRAAATTAATHKSNGTNNTTTILSQCMP